MAATYRTSAAGGSSSGTGNRTATITPAVGDLLVVYCFVAANTNDTPTCSDNNGSGTYDLIDVCNVVIAAVNYRLSVFVRTALMVNTTSTVITVATGSNTSGCVVPVAVSGMTRTGSNAVRSKGVQNNQAAGTAAPVLNQNALTTNLTIVAHGSADTTTTEPTGWTERQDTSQTNDTVALEVATRNSGFTGSTITFGAASSTTFCSHALELDGSTLFTRSAAVDGAGLIATAATFFSILERASLVNATGLIATVGKRELLRSSALNGVGSIATLGLFFTEFNRPSSLDAAGTIETGATFFSVLERSSSLNASASIESAANFFSTFERSTAIGATSASETSGQIESGARTIERSSSLSATGEISADGHSILERATSLTAAGGIATFGIFFTVFEGSTSCDAVCLISVTAQRELIRNASLNGAAAISANGAFFSIIERGVTVDGAASISASGSAPQAYTRSVSISASANIGVISIVVTPPIFSTNIPAESRTLTVQSESRNTVDGLPSTRVIEAESRSISVPAESRIA